MLVPSSATQTFQVPFSITVQVMTAGGDENPPGPSTSVPTVTRSFTDIGVTVTPSLGQVVIAGTYKTILTTTWQWLNNAGTLVTDVVPPSPGEYTKIVKMDAPADLTKDCVYTIDGSSFTHTVSLVTYTTGRDAMLALVKGAK